MSYFCGVWFARFCFVAGVEGTGVALVVVDGDDVGGFCWMGFPGCVSSCNVGCLYFVMSLVRSLSNPVIINRCYKYTEGRVINTLTHTHTRMHMHAHTQHILQEDIEDNQ